MASLKPSAFFSLFDKLASDVSGAMQYNQCLMSAKRLGSRREQLAAVTYGIGHVEIRSTLRAFSTSLQDGWVDLDHALRVAEYVERERKHQAGRANAALHPEDIQLPKKDRKNFHQ